MRRRDFISLFGGAAFAPLGARAQQALGLDFHPQLLGTADEVVE